MPTLLPTGPRAGRLARTLLALTLTAGALLGSAVPARAASKSVVAALGDGVPGGGVFTGPAFVGLPDAAGAGWLAFRSEVVQGPSPEMIVVTNLVTRERRAIAIGDEISEAIGTIRQFIGSPRVNANGAVAFAAIITPPQDAANDDGPTPAGIFVESLGSFRVVVAPGQDTPAGPLDLTTAVDPDEGGTDVRERTPALDDAGNVAFVARLVDGGNAIFRRPASGPLEVAWRSGDPIDGATVETLGPPAHAPGGALVVRARLTGATEGLFHVPADGPVTALVREGDAVDFDLPVPNRQTLVDFDPIVAVNEAGDVAFTAGPIVDAGPSGSSSGEQSVFVLRAGTIVPVGFPGRPLEEPNEISAVSLTLEAGGDVAPPRIEADGSVVFLAEVNSGASERVLRASPPDYVPVTIAELGGSEADASPAGGTYSFASSAPAVDAAGAVAFAARLAGTTTSEALVHLGEAGGEAIGIGDATPSPTRGVFGGPPFSIPRLNDQGDVVFKAFVARGPGIGIFRGRAGTVQALVRILDVAPVEPDDQGRLPRFTDLPGDPGLNATGDIAFAATVEGRGRGIFALDVNGVRKIALPGDPLPDPSREVCLPGAPTCNPATFFRLAPNPVIADDGSVVFRGTITSLDPDDPDGSTIREDAIFVQDGSGIRVVAATDEPSGLGEPFFRFRDPTAGSQAWAFRAAVGADELVRTGLFLGTASDVVPLAAEGDTLGDGVVIDELRGRPGLDATGNAAILARVVQGEETGTAIVQTGTGALTTLVRSGEPGPAGGRIRSLGRPTMSSAGAVAFRASFEPDQGGTPGFFVSDAQGIRPFLLIGERAPERIGGRITALSQDAALNGPGQLAFRATVSGGNARQAIFLASPADLNARRVTIKNGLSAPGDPRDRIKVKATLVPGDGSAGIDPAAETVAIVVADQERTLWSVTLSPGALTRRGGAFGPRDRRSLQSLVRKVAVKRLSRGRARVTATSPLIDVTQSGARSIVPPVTVRVEVGEDAGADTIECRARGRRFRCRP